MTNPQHDLHRLSRGLWIGGGLLILLGLVVFATRPGQIGMAEPGWFENESIRGDRWFIASGLGGLGGFLIIAGLMLTRRVRSVANALTSESAAAIGRGLSSGLAGGSPSPSPTGSPTSRLEDLEDLKRRGLVNDHEYQVKRSQILAAL